MVELYKHLAPVAAELNRMGKRGADADETERAFTSAMSAARAAIGEHRPLFTPLFDAELERWFADVSQTFDQLKRTPPALRGGILGRAAMLTNQIGVLTHYGHGPGLRDD